jgi:hypothetical protein
MCEKLGFVGSMGKRWEILGFFGVGDLRIGDLVTQGTAGIGTFPCPKIDRDVFAGKDGVVLC